MLQTLSHKLVWNVWTFDTLQLFADQRFLLHKSAPIRELHKRNNPALNQTLCLLSRAQLHVHTPSENDLLLLSDSAHAIELWSKETRSWRFNRGVSCWQREQRWVSSFRRRNSCRVLQVQHVFINSTDWHGSWKLRISLEPTCNKVCVKSWCKIYD